MTGEHAAKQIRWRTAAALLTNLAVLVGLGLVIVELRQNQKALDASVQLSIAELYQAMGAQVLENPELAQTFQDMFFQPDSLSPTEYMQAAGWTQNWNALLYATWQLRRSGAISAETWDQHARYFALYLVHAPAYRSLYESLSKGAYPDPFFLEITTIADRFAEEGA